MNDYQTLMSQLHSAHQNFLRQGQKWKDGELPQAAKDGANDREPENIVIARRLFSSAFNKLFDTKLIPLEARFQTDPASAVNEIIDFLAVDIPAFRCGSYKEFFLKKLKTTRLTPSQEQRIIKIFLKLCESRNVPREFRYWCELILSFADLDIVDDLMLLSKSTNNYTKTKSKLMMEMIFKDRKEVPNYT